MSDPDLPDLSSEIAERVHPPRFEAVLERARSQRRRQYAVVGVATAVVMGGGFGVAGLVDRTGPDPSPAPAPSPSPVSPSMSAEEKGRLIITDPKVHPAAISVSDAGDIAVLWQSISYVGTAFAVRTDEGPDIVGMIPGSANALTAEPDGWLVTGLAEPPLFLAVDGGVSSVPVTQQVSTPHVGDQAVILDGTEIGIYANKEHRFLKAPPLPAKMVPVSAATTDSGLIVASCLNRRSGEESAGRCVLSDGAWTYTAQTEGKDTFPAVTGASGDHVTVPTLGVTTNHVLQSLALLDGGRVTTVDVATLGLHGVRSVTVLDDGFTMLGDSYGQLTGVTRDGQTSAISLDRSFVLTSSGSRLWAASRDRGGPLLYSDDRGESWQEIVMPGLS